MSKRPNRFVEKIIHIYGFTSPYINLLIYLLFMAVVSTLLYERNEIDISQKPSLFTWTILVLCIKIVIDTYTTKIKVERLVKLNKDNVKNIIDTLQYVLYSVLSEEDEREQESESNENNDD